LTSGGGVFGRGLLPPSGRYRNSERVADLPVGPSLSPPGLPSLPPLSLKSKTASAELISQLGIECDDAVCLWSERIVMIGFSM